MIKFRGENLSSPPSPLSKSYLWVLQLQCSSERGAALTTTLKTTCMIPSPYTLFYIIRINLASIKIYVR